MGNSGRGRSTLIGRHKKMSIKHAGGPRQGHPSNKKWARITYLLFNAGVNQDPGTAMALVHAPGIGIPVAHGRVPQTNTPRNRGTETPQRRKQSGFLKTPNFGTRQ